LWRRERYDHELRCAAALRGRDRRTRHMMAYGMVFIACNVMVVHDVLFQEAGERARQRVGGGDLHPKQEQHSTARAPDYAWPSGAHAYRT
jgi:hypothetical protein